ncbi:hypothetical protein NDU88_004783 [Pleurodeles waltl]|uniref:Uncharacterized protein n=1 Tax=Pleurodeles waltl TaxID=8319 RepID=A0AAV7LJ63_PLEWA|nr:hypothetical protein NDU88_004783 [Pleurodeles waltl]
MTPWADGGCLDDRGDPVKIQRRARSGCRARQEIAAVMALPFRMRALMAGRSRRHRLRCLTGYGGARTGRVGCSDRRNKLVPPVPALPGKPTLGLNISTLEARSARARCRGC